MLEDGLTTLEVPDVSLLLKPSKQTQSWLSSSIYSRTIVAAARGGRLERLSLPYLSVQDPFAVRNLLPVWLNISDWGKVPRGDLHHLKWLAAATSLRPTLAQATRWLPVSYPETREDRLLTWSEVRSLLFLFDTDALPHPDQPSLDLPDWRPFMPYLEWLAEDVALAQQVADAWNAVVRRGEAKTCKCLCEKCR